MTVWQKAAAAAAALLESPRKIGPPPAPTPAARPLPVSLGEPGRGVRPVPVAGRLPQRSPESPRRDRRARLSERRRAERRVVNLGSPYGTERRSGRDDRQGDRRGAAHRAGIGLTRDYFSQSDPRVTSRDTGLLAGELIRFHD